MHGSSEYHYDENGNLTQIGNDIHLKYDALGRLISYESKDVRAAYIYDSFHRRISKITDNVENYLYDSLNEIGATDIDGHISQFRVLANPDTSERGSAVLIEIDNNPYLPVHDLFGNIVQLISIHEQKISESYAFDSFGIEQTSSPKNPWRFSSKRTDDESSFVYFGRRYYFPQLGRWITQDPKGYTDETTNLYLFALNDPLNHFDAYGLKTQSELFNNAVCDFLIRPNESLKL